jgi:hypothetical protein
MTLTETWFSGDTAGRTRFAVRTQTEWDAVWTRTHSAQEPPPTVVSPDFATEMAVVATMGGKPSSGFAIRIDSVAMHEKGAIVFVTERSPGASCITLAVLTAPMHAVRAPRTDGTIWWRERAITDNC